MATHKWKDLRRPVGWRGRLESLVDATLSRVNPRLQDDIAAALAENDRLRELLGKAEKIMRNRTFSTVAGDEAGFAWLKRIRAEGVGVE